MRVTTTLVLLGLSTLVFGSGCDLTKFTLNSTMADALHRASPAVEGHWDYDMVGEALPAQIVQMEGFLRIAPENEIFLEQATRAYTSYAYGWVEDRSEAAAIAGDYEESLYQLRRAKLLYARARDLGKFWISLDHDGMDEAMTGGLETFEAWLDREFDDPDEANKLLWTGYAWGSYINAAKDDMDAVADLPFAQALVERSVALDPNYYNGAGVTFLAVLHTSGLGANLDEAQQYWERALRISQRHSLLVLVNMAKTYAVKRQDRELFISLLREVLEAGDVMPEARLGNRIAKRRAARYLRQVDQLFVPAS